MASVSIADLTISITDNSKQAADQVMNLATACKTLRDSTKNTGLKQVSSEAAQLKSSTHGATSELQSGLEKSAKLASQVAASLNDVNKAYKNVSKGVQSAIDPALQKRMSSAKEKLQPILDKTDLQSNIGNMYSEAVKNGEFHVARFSETVKNVGNSAKRVFGSLIPESISRTVSQFMRLAKMRILRTIVKNLLAGFTEGLQNCYYWAKATGDQFANSMDTISTSMNYAKNSIGAAFSNILNIIAPVIDQVVDWLVIGINYINMFFAALSGATEYTRAKKVAVEYGTAAQNAIGGAAGAAKELKEQLSVLDFDELHQLQEQQDPSRGGGGGGGGGTPGTNYNEMFEKAKIDGWLLDNFKDILGVIEAIGAGILAWKFSNAFLSGLSTLQKLGVAISVAGFVLEFQGAYDMGHDGINLKNVLKTVGGALAGILGGVFAFGASSLLITVPLAVTIFLTGFILGGVDAAKEKYRNDPAFADIRNMLDESIRKLEEVREIRVRIKNIRVEYDDKMTNIETAQTLLNKLKIFNGIENPSDSQLAEIERLVGAINSMNLDGVTAQFELLNGKVQINIDELQEALDTLKEMAKQTALFDLYVEQAKAEVAMQQATQRLVNDYESGKTKYQEYSQIILDALDEPGSYVSRQWKPGDEVPALQWSANPGVAMAMQGVNDFLDTIANDVDAVGEAKAALEDVNELLEIFAENVLEVGEATKLITLPYAPTVYEKANKELDRPILGSSRYDLQKQYEQITGKESSGLNIFADPTKNALGFRQVATDAQNAAVQTDNLNSAYVDITDSGVELIVVSSKIDQNLTEVFGEMSNGATVVNDSTNRNKTYTGSLKLMGDESQKTSSTIVTALSGITKGVDMAVMGQTMASNFTSAFTNVGGNVKTAIEKDMNNIGGGMKYSTIMTNINNGLSTAQKATPFANIGVSIGGNMQSGSISGYNSETVMTKYQNGLTKYQKTTPFSPIGALIGGNMQSGSISGFNSDTVMTSYKNGLTNVQKTTQFSPIGALIGGNLQSGSISGFNSGAVMTAYQTGLTNTQKTTLFSPIGSAMGGDMQTGAYNGFSSAYIIAAYLKGLTSNQQSSMFSNVGRGMGGDIQNGANNGFSSWSVISAYLQGLLDAQAEMTFSNIGRNIAGDIKYGITNSLNGQTINVSTSVGGINSTTKGTMWVNMTAADGALGINAGTVFLAGEQGAETVGTINGRTGVANRDQIASAIAMALRPMLGNGGGTTTTNVNVQMDSRTVARASLKGQRAMNRQYNITAQA